MEVCYKAVQNAWITNDGLSLTFQFQPSLIRILFQECYQGFSFHLSRFESLQEVIWIGNMHIADVFEVIKSNEMNTVPNAGQGKSVNQCFSTPIRLNENINERQPLEILAIPVLAPI
ncbi:hypothetical protein ES705_50765 [subsurface metagenome]